MQSRSFRSLQLVVLLTATISAQTITSTIPVCPTASSTTITIPTTVTFCPGPHCNGGGSGPVITAGPNGIGRPGVNVGQYTSIGPDGKTTVLGIWETVYDSLCESGLVPATWTITQPCPCEATPHPTALPAGFTTTVVPCHVCGPQQSTITLTQPVATGPYAAQTPSVGQTNTVASAGANAIAAGPGGAAAAAAASAISGASAQAGPNGASANAAAVANAQAGPNAASASSQAGANAVAGIQATRPMNGTAPATNGTKPISNAPVQSFVSSASHISTAAFAICFGVAASFLL